MAQAQRQVSMGFTEDKFPVGTHMCLIYDNEDERRKTISKFLGAGQKEHEKVGYFVDTMAPADVEAWLREMGVVIPNHGNSPEFTIAPAVETYCPGGKFVPAEMLSGLSGLYHKSLEEGYAGSRVSGEMSWALRGIPGSECLIEYENSLNIVFETSPIVAICQCDARRFSGEVIADVLKVHPMMVVHGNVVKNPYYITPNEFLKSK